ncbi:MAG: FecR domain-containing protein [Gemmatimonadetes bacterium]|nr:FecR domain-containing protein [Gemmatimonadota bacterium]
MPASLAPLSPELFADFKAGKETALEQIVRANFEAFTQEANEKLQDIGGAQKVAASAFMDLWDRRAKVESVDQLQALLHQAINGETAHEMRRRAAAHHMAGNHAKEHEPTPAESIDQWWTKIAGVLHAAHADPATLAQQRAEHSRHEAAQHMQKVAGKKKTGFYAVVAILLFAAAAIPLWYLNKGAAATKAQQLLNKDDAKSMRARDGQRGTVTMEDSVVVRMGSSTTVKYTKSYPLDARAMQIQGVAAIKAPKLDSPLMVKVGNAWVDANDAEFVGRSFPEDSNSAMLKVLSGNVTVRFGQESKSLESGAMLLVLNNGTLMDLDENKAKLAFNWIDGTFLAENQPLRKVLSEIKRWYGIDIVPKDSSFMDRPVSISAALDSAKVAIRALEEGGAVKVTLTSETRGTLVDNAGKVKSKRR